MESEVKQITEVKKFKSLTVPLSPKAHKNLLAIQKQFKKTTGGTMAIHKIAGKALENATL